jgi:DHA2 family multidrug resistance protein
MQAEARTVSRSGNLEYKWIVTIVVIIGAFMAILDSTIVNIAIPRLQTAFGSNLNSVQWVLTGYILTQGVITPTTAFFSDRFGSKRWYIIALTIFTLGSALCGLAWSLPVLIIFRILQGIGGAFLIPLALTLLYSEFPPEQRGFASGVFGIPILLAPALGPTVGGYIVTYAGWPLIFYINLPIGIIGVILASLLLRETRREGNLTFDVWGFVFSALGLAGVLYALSDASTNGWGSIEVLGTLIGGLICLAIFTFIEISLANRGGRPLVDLRLFATRSFTASCIAIVFVSVGLFGGLFIIPIYLQNLRSLSAFQAGLLLLPQAFAAMVSVLIGGRLVDRIGVRAVVIPGLLLLIYANWQLAYINTYTPYWWLQTLFVVRGLGLGLCNQPLIVTALSEIRPRQLNQASSLTTVVRFIASSLGIAVLATLVQTQAKIHYSHLAEQVTPASPLGQLLARIQAYYVMQGRDLMDARNTAIQIVIGLVQGQGYALAIQDAFKLTTVITVLAVFVVFFVKGRQRNAQTTERRGETNVATAEGRREQREPVLAE